MREIRVIGLTGQTGAGKSTVSTVMREKGIPVIDADLVAREVVETGKSCLVELALEFSAIILNADGSLNRRKLADIVFGNREKLDRLNQIIFAYIIEEIKERIGALDEAGHYRMVIIDAPTLFESGGDAICDEIISVIAPESHRLNRIVIRDRLTGEQAAKRMASQYPDSYYIERSNHVIVNDDGLVELRAKTLALLEKLGIDTNHKSNEFPVSSPCEIGGNGDEEHHAV